MTTIIPQCLISCKHFRPGKPGSFACDAFPGRIPNEILFNEFDHRNPHPFDNGIQWEAKPGETHPIGEKIKPVED